MAGTAVFELFVRRLPPGRAFLVAAGLEQALDFVEEARFSDEDLAWVERSGRFAPGFAQWLRAMRFKGEVWAMPEGTVFFAAEPVLRVVAPIAQAQWLETRILNLIHLQTVIASKAARAARAPTGADRRTAGRWPSGLDLGSRLDLLPRQPYGDRALVPVDPVERIGRHAHMAAGQPVARVDHDLAQRPVAVVDAEVIDVAEFPVGRVHAIADHFARAAQVAVAVRRPAFAGGFDRLRRIDRGHRRAHRAGAEFRERTHAP